MIQSSSHLQLTRFAAFEVDPAAGELRKQGIKVKLQEQPFQNLLMLLEHPGQVVTREALRSRLWASDTFVDFDHGLNKAVTKLREALGDSAENPPQATLDRALRFLTASAVNPGLVVRI